MDFQDWEEAHIIRKCEKSQQQSAKIFLMTYLMNRGRYVPLMSLYETPGIQQTAALNAVVQNIRLIMPGVHRVAHEVAIEEPSQSDTEVTVDAGGDVPVEKPLAPFSASTAIRGDASTPTNAQKNMIKALRRHEERKEKISPVNQPVMSWAAPVERSPVAEEVRSPAPPQRAAPATPVDISQRSPPLRLRNDQLPKGKSRGDTLDLNLVPDFTSSSPVYKSPPTPYAALPESYRPSPLRNPILLIHQEIASPEPATTTPIRPYNPRNGELTPHSDQRSGQSTPRSVQSDRVLQIIKSPVSSSSPPTAPLKNMSPFAPPPEPPVEQSIVEAEAFKTPAKRHARRTVLATPSRSARPQTRRRNQEEMEIDESVEDTGATDAMDVEVEQASATPMKTPARRSTRVAAAISRTEPRALRKTPARRAHADHEETAGADENEGTSQMEVEPVKPITGRKTAGRRGKAGQLADEEQELPSTPSRKPRQPPKSKSTKKAPAATPARVTRTSSRESTPALDDPMTLDDLATPGKTPAARGGRRKAAAATPAAATPSSARPVTRALARQLGGN
ncbi:hypothetical protein HK097_001502 [Rhizophlyctis rosea]|uniref:Uncharacterized protein n=1 Tax=Rhizophlyctis rosea TaxID=64517 RepID=A0AAD5X6D2_9FUNG|nr:hypothetical protein HK097_001502 [Rhizophlyctis rosea]